MRSDVASVAVGLDGCAVPVVHADTVAHVRSRALAEPELERVAGTFRLLGDPTRSRLLYALLEAGELCVCDLAAATDTQEATVSQSLRMLRASGIVSRRRSGRRIYYRLADAHVRMLLDLTREHLSHDPDAEGAIEAQGTVAVEGTVGAGGTD